MNERVLSLNGICKRFGKTRANDDISFDLYQGEVLALLGENGAGKTTLMNILFGHYRADAGHVEAFGQTLDKHTPQDALSRGIGMVHQHFTLADSLTVLDNILIGTESLWQPFSRRAAAQARIENIMQQSGLHVDIHSRIQHLTVGERQRVEILKALYREARILILDEPTAVLTPGEVDNLFVLIRRMASKGLSIIIISHKLNEVLAISDRVVVLRHGKVVGTTNTESVNRKQLASMIVGREVKRPQRQPKAAGRQLLALKNLSIRETGSTRLLLDEVSLALHAGHITGMAGVSGNGQAVLADLLSGIRSGAQGQLEVLGEKLSKPEAAMLIEKGIARIPEDRHSHGVVSEMTLWENLQLDEPGKQPAWRNGIWLDRSKAKAHARELIESFDIRCNGSGQPAGLLSGGNMQKLILARNLSRNPQIIIANQPTRGLDEGAIATVHQLLLDARDQGAGILLISEDLEELMQLSDSIVVMHNGKLSQPVPAADLTLQELGMQLTGAVADAS